MSRCSFVIIPPYSIDFTIFFRQFVVSSITDGTDTLQMGVREVREVVFVVFFLSLLFATIN